MTIVPDTGRKLGAAGVSPSARGGGSGAPLPATVTTTAAARPLQVRPPSREEDQKNQKKQETTSSEKKKGGKKKLLLVLLVVVVLGAGFYFVKLKPHPVYKSGQPVPNGKVVSIGPITANTADGRLVQVQIALQLSAVANTKQEATDAPQLTNTVISELANFTYAQLLTNAARTTLQSQLLAAFQKIMGTVDGAAQQVNAVYFTSFILQ